MYFPFKTIILFALLGSGYPVFFESPFLNPDKSSEYVPNLELTCHFSSWEKSSFPSSFQVKLDRNVNAKFTRKTLNENKAADIYVLDEITKQPKLVTHNEQPYEHYTQVDAENGHATLYKKHMSKDQFKLVNIRASHSQTCPILIA